jgi:hypothetical protein
MGTRSWSFCQQPGAYSKDHCGIRGDDSVDGDERELDRAGLHYERLLFADKRDSELIKGLSQNYQLVPQRLVFSLARDRNFHDSRDVNLQTRGLADGTVRFEKDDVVNLKILPVYTSMLINRGRYLALFNQNERAIAAFRQALALDPGLAAARQGLAESIGKLRNP